MKHFIKRYCAEIVTAFVIIAACLFVVPFVLNIPNETRVLIFDCAALVVVLLLFAVFYFWDYDPNYKYNDYKFNDTDNDTKPDATPEYNAEGELVVNGRGVFDPFTTTLGGFLRWFFGWDNPNTIYPPAPRVRVGRGVCLTPDLLRAACDCAGIETDELNPVGAWFGLQPTDPRGATFDAFAGYIRDNWKEVINVSVENDIKELVYVFNVGETAWEVPSPYYWGAPIE